MKKWISLTAVATLLITLLSVMLVPAPIALADGARLSADSLLPASAAQFRCVNGGSGTVTVAADAQGGYTLTCSNDSGWPSASFDTSDMLMTNMKSGDRLAWDFEVVSGMATIYVYFCGQNPDEMAAIGSYVSINGLIDPSCVDPLSGMAMSDLPVGNYQGSADVADLGYAAQLLGDNYEMGLTGVKIYVVGGTVKLRKLGIERAQGGNATTTTTTTTATDTETTATAPSTEMTAVSLLPSSVSDFVKKDVDGYSVNIAACDEGYRFTSDGSWPCAWYSIDDVKKMIRTNNTQDAYLHYDIEVVSGAAKIMVLFAGQHPNDVAMRGSFVTINGLEHPEWVDPLSGDTANDLPVGVYEATVPVSELGYNVGLIGENDERIFSGMKIFAVAGDIIIRDLSIRYTQTTKTTAATTTRTTMTLPNTRIVSAQSLMPATVSDFARASGAGGIVAISPHGNGYRFVTDQGWPCAWYEGWFDDKLITVTDIENTYLRYDFEVVSGATKVLVYFAGQSPEWQGPKGSFVTINGLENPDWIDSSSGDTAQDLPVGTYTAMVPISELGYSDNLLGPNGEMLFSGMKMFAVAGETIIYDLSIVTVEETASEGDIDNNGIVNMRDALMIYQYASGKNKSLTAEQLNTADIDKNGTINMRDALALFRTASGK